MTTPAPTDTPKTAVKQAAAPRRAAPAKKAAPARTPVVSAAPAPAKKVAPAKPMAAKPATVKSTAAKPAKAAKPEKHKKPKLVRDSFTIPKNEYELLVTLKARSAALKQPAKKSEVLRAGVKLLATMKDAEFLAALRAVPSLKTGRPAGDKH